MSVLSSQCAAMKPCFWFLILQEFGALQTSLLKHNRRLKQRDSLPLNAARGAGNRKSPSVVQGQSSGRGLRHEVPQRLKLLAHIHIIYCILPYARFFADQRGAWPKWPNGKYASDPSPIQSLPLSPFLLPSPESGGSGGSP